MRVQLHANQAGRKEACLHSRCFFLGAITSWVVALQTARAMSDPVSWYCAAAMRSVSVCPDIFCQKSVFTSGGGDGCWWRVGGEKNQNVTKSRLLSGCRAFPSSSSRRTGPWPSVRLEIRQIKTDLNHQSNYLSALNKEVKVIWDLQTYPRLWIPHPPGLSSSQASAPWTATASLLCNNQRAINAICAFCSEYFTKTIFL